jgi:hypothetical protein
MCYYLVKWLSEPYTLQIDRGMSGMIPARTMVGNALYLNRVQRAPHWHTPSSKTTVVEAIYVWRTGLQLQPINVTNALPLACARAEATRKKAVKVSLLDHKAIMEEVSKRDRLEYKDDNNDNDKSEEESNEENEESKSESKSK